MPFKSEAQRRKFAEMVKTGEISQKTFNEWNTATGKKSLPEKIGKTNSKNPRWSKVRGVK